MKDSRLQDDYSFTSEDSLTNLVRTNGISNCNELLTFVRMLPYGRNANRKDFSLVIREKQGTCSSKHALVKKIADLNQITDVKLILGLYKMNQINTPKIGNELTKNEIEFIPEAHCYLKINNERLDITSENSSIGKIEKDIISELEIEPEQVADFKVEYHKKFLKNWISENKIDFLFDEIWSIREKCIGNLSK